MPKDYARSPRKAAASKAGGKGASANRPSGRPAAMRWFGGGMVAGAAAVLALLYGPGLVGTYFVADSAATPPGEEVAAKPALTYEFIHRLPSEEVVTNVTPYVPPPLASDEPSPAAADDRSGDAPDGAGEPQPYFLQAASFRHRDDADAMRARLLLEGMQVAVNAVARPGGGTWHRVLVGPFESKRDMQRVLSQLRTKDIPAMPVASASPAG